MPTQTPARLYLTAARQVARQPNHPFRPTLERLMDALREMYPEEIVDVRVPELHD